MNQIEKIIDEAWENKDHINQNSDALIINSINQIIEDLDNGKVRVAENISDNIESSKNYLDFKTKDLSSFLNKVSRGEL